jgi:predicted membrane protein
MRVIFVFLVLVAIFPVISTLLSIWPLLLVLVPLLFLAFERSVGKDGV